jgi:hypothetical protein
MTRPFEPVIEYWSPEMTGGNLEKFVERCAKIAHRSEGKITDDSYLEFLPRVVVRHRDWSVAEHAGIVAEIPYKPRHRKHLERALLSLYSINPFFQYELGEDKIEMLLNGRFFLDLNAVMEPYAAMQRYEAFPNFQWHLYSLARRVFPNLFYPSPTPINLDEEYSSSSRRLLKDGLHIFVDAFNFTSQSRSAHNFHPNPKLQLATYFATNVSRVTEVQWVRHRRMSFTIMSGRAVDTKEQEVYWPDEVDKCSPELKQKLIDFEKASDDLYAELRAAKVSKQTARYWREQGRMTEIGCTAPVNWWQYWFGLRCVPPAQSEHQLVAQPIQKDLYNLFPDHKPLETSKDL